MGLRGRILGSPLGGAVQSSGKILGVFPPLLATCIYLSQIISNNVWFLVNQLSVSCEGPVCVNRTALSCLELMAALS